MPRRQPYLRARGHEIDDMINFLAVEQLVVQQAEAHNCRCLLCMMPFLFRYISS